MTESAAVVLSSDDLVNPSDAMRSLGFDPAEVQAVVITETTAIAIAADYPEPTNPPQEAS